MRIAFVGLGKMGGNMALRLVRGAPDGSVPGGHEVIGYARDPNRDLQNVPTWSRSSRPRRASFGSWCLRATRPSR
jgi:3-hydroxyisobutyrate dehydrogenase-like beta-hydroxyacid dehydrogenase